jgi:hypothetical protein
MRIGIGLLLIGAGSLLDMLVSPNSEWTILIPGLVMTGVGVGLSSPTLASAAAAAVPATKAGMAGGAVNTLRQLGFALGIPIMATALSTTIRPILAGHFPDPDTATAQVAGGQAGDALATLPQSGQTTAAQAIRDAYTSGLDTVLLISGVSALITGVLVLLLVRRATDSETTPAEATTDA